MFPQHTNERKAAKRRLNRKYGSRQVRKQILQAIRDGEPPEIVRRDSGQHPKLEQSRKRTQHKHELRDEHSAFTYVGRWPRRKWLAGFSQHRGY